MDSTGSGYSPVACFCWQVNEHQDIIKCVGFLDQLPKFQLLKKDSDS
jgi:hypothetical protein